MEKENIKNSGQARSGWNARPWSYEVQLLMFTFQTSNHFDNQETDLL